MSNKQEEIIDFDEMFITMEECFGLKHKPQVNEKLDVTDCPAAPYFVSKPYRSILGRYDNDARNLAAFISLVSGVENDIISDVLWNNNPMVRININPGAKQLHISPNHIADFFEELVNYKS